MPAAFTDEHWALLAKEYVDLAVQAGVHFPNVALARRYGIDKKVVGTRIFRLRRYGFLEPFTSRTEPPRLTQKAKSILDGMNYRKGMPVLFNLEIVAESKSEALAEVWDVVQQLEHWDDRTGEPFRYRPARIKDA